MAGADAIEGPGISGAGLPAGAGPPGSDQQAGEPFSIRVIWLVNAQELQTIPADCDANAQVIAVKQRTLAPSM